MQDKLKSKDDLNNPNSNDLTDINERDRLKDIVSGMSQKDKHQSNPLLDRHVKDSNNKQ